MERQNCFPTFSRTIPPFFHLSSTMSCARRQLLRATSNLRSTTIRVSSRVTPLLARQATNTARAFSSSRYISQQNQRERTTCWSHCHCSQSKFVALRVVGNSIASVNARHYSSKSKYINCWGGICKSVVYTQTPCLCVAYPEHQLIAMPALSPT